MKRTLSSLTVVLAGAILPAYGQTVATPHDSRVSSQADRLTTPKSGGHAANSVPQSVVDKREMNRWAPGAAMSRRASEPSGIKAQPLRLANVAAGEAVSPNVGHTDSNTGSALNEVIVTAQKYRQRAFDVPISMSVVGGPELQRLQVTNLKDLQIYVPGMVVENNGTGLYVSIRGMSNFFGQQALVGVYLDDYDITTADYGQLSPTSYDLARVEVLKGPQGTLYGEGSLGGTIRYITNKPVLDDFQMQGDATALFDQYGAPGERIDTVINVPVISGVLGVRVASDIDREGGWVDQPAANQKNINGNDLADVRIEGRWKPSTEFTVDATEVIHRQTSGPYTGENPVGTYTQVFGLTTTPSIEDDYNISGLTLQWSPGPITVVNSATYLVYHSSDYNRGTSYQFTPPPSPRSDELTTEHTVEEDLSDELRVSNAGPGLWRWTVGGIFKRLDYDNLPFYYYFGVPGPPGSGLPVPPYFYYQTVNSNSRSAFADTSYKLLGKLVVGAGVRVFKDDENALIVGDAEEERGTFSSVDPRFYLRYGISRSVNVYASAAKGFRSGGFNGFGLPEFQPEHVWTYEVGTKERLLDGRMNINSDVFLSNYGGYQIFGIIPNPPSDITSNGGNARIKGVEADVMWAPVKGWRIGLSGDYLNARFVQINVTDDSYQVGDPLDDVPRYLATASLERELLWHGRAAYARVDYTQRARTTFRNRNIGSWYYSQSDYMYLLGLRTGISLSTSLEIGVFVQNVLNDRGYIGQDVIENFAAREQPRTFGVDFQFRLE